MLGGPTMKHIVAGLILLIFVVITPFPALLSIPGMAWRTIIGLFGCDVLVSGIYKTVKK